MTGSVTDGSPNALSASSRRSARRASGGASIPRVNAPSGSTATGGDANAARISAASSSISVSVSTVCELGVKPLPVSMIGWPGL